MDYQVLFNVALGLAAFLAGWVLNNITKAVQRLDNDVRGMQLNYISKEDYHRDLVEIKDALRRIEDKFEKKVGSAFKA